MTRQPSVAGLRRQLDALYADVDHGHHDPHGEIQRHPFQGAPNVAVCAPCAALASGLLELEAELRRAELRRAEARER